MLVRVSSLVLTVFLFGCGDKKEKRSDAPKQAPSTSLLERQQGVDSDLCKLEGNIRGFRLTCEKDIAAFEIDGIKHEDRLYFNSNEKTVMVRVSNILGGADTDKESLRFIVILEDGRTTEVVVNTSGQPIVSGDDLDKFTPGGTSPAKADAQKLVAEEPVVVEEPVEEKKEYSKKDSDAESSPESLTSQGYVLSAIDPNFYVKYLPNAIVYVSKNFIGDDIRRQGIVGFRPLTGSHLRYGQIEVNSSFKGLGSSFTYQTNRSEGMQFLEDCLDCIDFRVVLYGKVTKAEFTLTGLESYGGNPQFEETASLKIQ